MGSPGFESPVLPTARKGGPRSDTAAVAPLRPEGRCCLDCGVHGELDVTCA